MLNTDSDALECDLAETYHIYNYKELTLKKVALFSVGLREESRIKMKILNIKYPFKTILMSDIADKLAMLLWIYQGAKKNEKPDLILPKLFDVEMSKFNDKDIVSFASIEDFEEERKRIIGIGVK